VDTSGTHNFIVEVNLAGQLTRWKRNNQQEQTDTSPVSKGEEEEEDNESEVIDIYPQQSMSRRNPPRSQKPPDKLTY